MSGENACTKRRFHAIGASIVLDGIFCCSPRDRLAIYKSITPIRIGTKVGDEACQGGNYNSEADAQDRHSLERAWLRLDEACWDVECPEVARWDDVTRRSVEA
jgi:hypothetical protein